MKAEALPFPSVILTLTCGHLIHMLLPGETPNPWTLYDRAQYPPQVCVERECRRFGIQRRDVWRVKPYYPRAYKKGWQA